MRDRDEGIGYESKLQMKMTHQQYKEIPPRIENREANIIAFDIF